MDRFARIGAGWIATCLGGGAVALITGWLLPAGYEAAHWILIAVGIVLIAIGVTGLLGELLVGRGQPQSDHSDTRQAIAGTRNITVAGSNNTINVSEAAAERLIASDDPLAPFEAVDDALVIADSAFADPDAFDKDKHWHRAEFQRLATSSRELTRKRLPAYLPELDRALVRNPTDGPHEGLQMRAVLARVRGVIGRIRVGDPPLPTVVIAHAQAAVASAQAPNATIGLTGTLATRVIPGPGSATLDQVSYETEGRRHFAYGGLGRRPKAIRFDKPEDRILRPTDLPAEIPSGAGRLVVEKFYSDGVVIDEDGTSGDSVGFVVYFDEPPELPGPPARRPDLASAVSIGKAPGHLGRGDEDPARLGLTAHVGEFQVNDFRLRLVRVMWLPTNGSLQELEILPGPIEWEDGVYHETLPPGATRTLWLVDFRDDGPWIRLQVRKQTPNPGRYSLELEFQADGLPVHRATYQFDFNRTSTTISSWGWV